MPHHLPALLHMIPPIHVAVALDNSELLDATIHAGFNDYEVDFRQIAALHLAVGTPKMCTKVAELGLNVNAGDLAI